MAGPLVVSGCGAGADARAARGARRRRRHPGVGHDWVIGGTLAGGVMQAEMMLTTRNLTAVAHFLPMLGRISNFMEGRRVQDSR